MITPERAALVKRYKHWRELGKKLSHSLLKSLDVDAIDEGGKALGIMENGTLVFDSEEEMAVLADFCIHHVRRGGKNAMDRMLEEDLSEEERTFVRARARSRYSIFRVKEVERGVGIVMEDVFRKQDLFVVDVNFSSTARPGALLASQMVEMEGFWMTTGAALPVHAEAAGAIDKRVGQWIEKNHPDWGNLAPEKESELARIIVRACLRENQDVQIRYADAGDEAEIERVKRLNEQAYESEPPTSSEERIGRNDPCPCGSGKKYKKCCGR
jgi:hypothetical protein